MSPASGDVTRCVCRLVRINVSIQLMSPASGDFAKGLCAQQDGTMLGFHSINVPSEWGPLNFKPLPSKVSRDSFRGSGKK